MIYKQPDFRALDERHVMASPWLDRKLNSRRFPIVRKTPLEAWRTDGKVVPIANVYKPVGTRIIKINRSRRWST